VEHRVRVANVDSRYVHMTVMTQVCGKMNDVAEKMKNVANRFINVLADESPPHEV
jgi:uncharacterized coiled-coil protein SlyX